MSTALAEVAYDMSSLRNLRFEDSMSKIQAALAGEVEPLRRIGVTVNETATKLWAQREGLDDNVKAWSEQQKVIARAGVIFQGLQKDMGDLNRTQGSTTNLLRSIADQFKTISIAIYENWKPYIQDVLTSLRDWLVENRNIIADWAGRLAAHLVYVKDVFASFVDILQKSPKEGFSVLMESLIEVMRAAAEIAVDLAVRIGKGIWEGVRAGVLGEGKIDEAELRRRTAQYYLSTGGHGPRTVDLSANTVLDVKPDDKALYAKAEAYQRSLMQQELNRKKVGEITGPLLAGFGENWKDAFSHIGEGVRQISTDMGAGLDEANAKLRESLAALNEGAAVTQADEGVQSLSRRLPDLNAAWRAAGDGASELGEAAKQLTIDVAQASARVFDQIDSKSKKSFEARRALIEAEYEEYKKVIKDMVALAQWKEDQLTQLSIEEAKAGGDFFGGLNAGLVEMKRELQTAGELGADVALELRDGFASSFADAITGARDFGEAMEQVGLRIVNMFAEFYAKQAFTAFLPGRLPAWTGTGGGLTVNPNHPAGVNTMSHGGLVYASSGLFTPRGTDTVPAMLTPGEGVLDTETTAKLRRVLQVEPSSGGSSVALPTPVFNITDATAGKVTAEQANVQFDGRRMLVGMVLKDRRNNGPMSRADRRK